MLAPCTLLLTQWTLADRMPAAHDDSGHAWHHPNAVLFGITRNGMNLRESR